MTDHHGETPTESDIRPTLNVPSTCTVCTSTVMLTCSTTFNEPSTGTDCTSTVMACSPSNNPRNLKNSAAPTVENSNLSTVVNNLFSSLPEFFAEDPSPFSSESIGIDLQTKMTDFPLPIAAGSVTTDLEDDPRDFHAKLTEADPERASKYAEPGLYSVRTNACVKHNSPLHRVWAPSSMIEPATAGTKNPSAEAKESRARNRICVPPT
jgi:hypothetical protein